MQVESPTEQSMPLALKNLPDPGLPGEDCPRRTRWDIDLLLVALEALDLNGGETMLAAIQEMQLQSVIAHRVALWRLRCSNPFRRFSSRQPLTLEQAKALAVIICNLARRQTVSIRQLLLVYDQLKAQQLSPDSHISLGDYLERFRRHFRSRMNLKRSALSIYSTNEQLNALALRLLRQLLFCTGTAGAQRIWASLFDGEVV
jgi:hypothetical protein